MSNRTQYENDLAALKTALTEMGQSAADAVEAAMEALCTADAEAADGAAGSCSGAQCPAPCC